LIFAEVEEGPDKFYEKCGFRKVNGLAFNAPEEMIC
jgi:hypothetical protein